MTKCGNLLCFALMNTPSAAPSYSMPGPRPSKYLPSTRLLKLSEAAPILGTSLHYLREIVTDRARLAFQRRLPVAVHARFPRFTRHGGLWKIEAAELVRFIEDRILRRQRLQEAAGLRGRR